MRKHVLIAMMIAVLIGVMQVFPQAQSAAQQELIKLENAWSEAVVKQDAAALERLYASEYLSTDPEGATFNKTQDIANVKTGAFKMTAYKLEDLKVNIYGETAVVTGRNTIKATYQGKDVSGAYRFTDVFVKRSGQWQCVATQGSLVAKK